MAESPPTRSEIVWLYKALCGSQSAEMRTKSSERQNFVQMNNCIVDVLTVSHADNK